MLSGLLTVGLFVFCHVAITGAKGQNARCHTYGGYQTVAKGRYKCILFEPSWDESSAFELEYRHCLKTPTINLFIRNFQNIDEINHDFVQAEKNLRFKAYTGKTAKLMTNFKVIKENKGKGIQRQLRIKIYYQPNTKDVRIENVLTATFNMDDTDDCNFLDKLEYFERIFLGIGLSLFVILSATLACFIRRRKTLKERSSGQVPTYL